MTKAVLARFDHDPVILSHHPLCGKFQDHVFKMRGRFLCLGCFTVYPSALVAVLFLLIADFNSFAITLPIAVASFALYFLRFLTKMRGIRVALDMSLGVSVGASLLSALNSPENLRFIVIPVGITVAIVFSYLKGRKVFTTCKSCSRYSEFPSCCFPDRPPEPEASTGLTPTLSADR